MRHSVLVFSTLLVKCNRRFMSQTGKVRRQPTVRDVQVVEGSLMEDLSVPAGAGEPRRDGGLSKAEDLCGGGGIQSFSQRRERHCDLESGAFRRRWSVLHLAASPEE